mgnify:CR=1 FL=1
MILVIGALILGFFVATLRTFTEKQRALVGAVSEIALMLLLFSMGLSLGSNPQLLAALPILGLKSFILALGILAGSVGLTWLAAMKRNMRS